MHGMFCIVLMLNEYTKEFTFLAKCPNFMAIVNFTKCLILTCLIKDIENDIRTEVVNCIPANENYVLVIISEFAKQRTQ